MIGLNRLCGNLLESTLQALLSFLYFDIRLKEELTLMTNQELLELLKKARKQLKKYHVPKDEQTVTLSIDTLETALSEQPQVVLCKDCKHYNETYIAKIRKSNGWYAIDFPDLSGTHAQCKDLNDVQKEAEKSLCDFLVAARLVGQEIPTPSKSVELKEGEMALAITVKESAI